METLHSSLCHAVREHGAVLPLPGSGETLRRWQALASVGADDLSLVKLYEGHTDAMAIMSELGAPLPPAGSLWGTWCAEPPAARVTLSRRADSDELVLLGRKSWCSGAGLLSHALVSAWNDAGEACLARVELRQPGVRVTDEGWHAFGMSRSGSVDVHFDHARAEAVGAPGAYVARAGFWHGAAGVAACWWGGARAIADMTRGYLARRSDPHAAAHLGAIDASLCSSAALLRETAAWIDAHPLRDAQVPALRLRHVVDECAGAVVRHASRALGAAPLCRDPRFARAVADLPVFVRQSHAERDLAALGNARLQATDAHSWAL